MTTIHDVARLAGVSPVTVSRVMNGASNVNAATRERVEQAISELGYVRNMSARSLRSRQTFTLALIVPDITNAFWTTVARGVEDAAQGEGYSLLLCNSDENPGKQKEYIHTMLQQRVDGVLIAPYDSNAGRLSQLQNLNIPTVVMDRQVYGWEVDTVRADSISGAYALTQHLINLGHRRIAIISGPSVTSTAEERVAGYCLALDEAGIEIDPQLILRGEFRFRSGKMLADQLLEGNLKPTAIVATNNVMSMGVLESINQHGLRVPQDMALVSFDELPDLARFFPFLTVAVQPAYEMGINAAQLLLSRIQASAPLQPRHVILPVRLVLRYSCGRLLQNEQDSSLFVSGLKDNSETVLVKPLQQVDVEHIRIFVPGLEVSRYGPSERGGEVDQSNTGRLLKVLFHREADRLPHVEGRIASRALVEYVLQRSLPAGQAVSPADHVEFARQLGIDAVGCEIAWQPEPVPNSPAENLVPQVMQVSPPPSLTEHFNRIETFLRAAQGSKVGVYIGLGGFVAPAFHASGMAGASQEDLLCPGAVFERFMEMIYLQQERAIRSITDRFAADLVFVILRDDLLCWPGASLDHPFFMESIFPRLKRLIAPVLEHSIPLGLDTPGSLKHLAPFLYKYGFTIIQGSNPACNDLPALRADWRGKLAFIGGFPREMLATGSRETVEEQVQQTIRELARGGGYVFGTAGDLTEDIRPELFMTMTRAAHRFGMYKTAASTRR
jgi:LacI family transcriptional regulator